jgi:hypothetical protein
MAPAARCSPGILYTTCLPGCTAGAPPESARFPSPAFLLGCSSIGALHPRATADAIEMLLHPRRFARATHPASDLSRVSRTRPPSHREGRLALARRTVGQPTVGWWVGLKSRGWLG